MPNTYHHLAISHKYSEFEIDNLIIQLIERKTLENTEEAIQKEKSRETVNIGYTGRRKTKQKHNTRVGHHYAQNKHK